jgi:hypothetical protein
LDDAGQLAFHGGDSAFGLPTGNPTDAQIYPLTVTAYSSTQPNGAQAAVPDQAAQLPVLAAPADVIHVAGPQLGALTLAKNRARRDNLYKLLGVKNPENPQAQNKRATFVQIVLAVLEILPFRYKTEQFKKDHMIANVDNLGDEVQSAALDTLLSSLENDAKKTDIVELQAGIKELQNIINGMQAALGENNAAAVQEGINTFNGRLAQYNAMVEVYNKSVGDAIDQIVAQAQADQIAQLPQWLSTLLGLPIIKGIVTLVRIMAQKVAYNMNPVNTRFVAHAMFVEALKRASEFGFPISGSPEGLLNGKTVREAVNELVAAPAQHYFALSRGAYGVVAPRLTAADQEEARMRANATGLNVVMYTTITESEAGEYTAQSDRSKNSGRQLYTRVVATARGSLTIVATVRQAEENDEVTLTNTALEAAYVFFSDLVFAKKANRQVFDTDLFRDGYIGTVPSVLEMKFMSPSNTLLNELMQYTVDNPITFTVNGQQIRYATRNPVVIKGANAVEGAHPIARDGTLTAHTDALGYFGDLANLNTLALNKNDGVMAPAPAVGAIAKVQITAKNVKHAVDLVASAAVIQNAKANDIDTILVDVSPDAWKDGNVLQQLRSIQTKLQLSGLRLGFYETVGARAGNLDRFEIMASLRSFGFGAAVVYLNNESKSTEQIKTIQDTIKKINADTIVLVQGQGPEGSRTIATDGLRADSIVLATESNIEDLANASDRMGSALPSMIILDKNVYGEISERKVEDVSDKSVGSQLRTLITAFMTARSHKPTYRLMKGRSDGLRNVVDNTQATATAEEITAAIINATQTPETLADMVRNLSKYQEAQAAGNQKALSDVGKYLAGFKLRTFGPIDIAYAVGFVEGVLENNYANEPIMVEGEKEPVVLTKPYREMYGRIRLLQVMAGVSAKPASNINPLEAARTRYERLRPIIAPLDTKLASNANEMDVVTTAMNAVNELTTIARSTSDTGEKEIALAAIIELLRLYGEREMKKTAEEETLHIAPALIKDMLGAA